MWGRWHPSEEYTWSPSQNRDESETAKRMGVDPRDRPSFERDMYRQGTFESVHDIEPPMRYVPGPPRPMEQVHSMMHARPQAMMPEMERHSGAIRLRWR